jgi:tetratricopeptide (TPR) repeat protein
VPHVRQAHATFAPASLAQVLAFHGDPVDHLAIADKVCFAGTPVRRQRACAEARGHLVVEFDVTMDAARRLVDARLPFLRTTASSTASHARVTFGYDLARDCLFTRDPALPSIGEVPGDALAKQRWHGPHGLLVAPPHRRGDVDGLHLPQRDAWRLRAKLEAALERKDFEEAERTLEELGSADASASHLGHARLSIARARRDVRVEPESVEALLVLHPEAASLEVSRLDLLRTEQSQAEHAAALSARALSDDAAVLGAVAEGLRDTVARRPIAGRAALRAASIAPGWGYPLHALADLWGADDGVDERAMEAYRAATLLDEANDHFAAAYDAHANRRGAGEESLAWLRERARRALGKGVRPAIVLGEALRARALSRTRRPPWSRRRPSAPPGQRSRAPRRGRCGWRTRSLGTGGRRTRSGGSSARAARRPSRRGALRGGPRGAAGASRRRVRPAPRGVARPGRSRGDGPRARPRDALGRERRGACVRRRGLREAPLLARDGGDLLHRVARQPGHADREDRGGARAVVERCLLRRERVLARLEANDVEGAVACAEDTVRRNRGDAYGRAIRGLALGASGDRARAVDACKAALALDVDAVLAIDLLAGSRAAPAQVEGGSRS